MRNKKMALKDLRNSLGLVFKERKSDEAKKAFHDIEPRRSIIHRYPISEDKSGQIPGSKVRLWSGKEQLLFINKLDLEILLSSSKTPKKIKMLLLHNLDKFINLKSNPKFNYHEEARIDISDLIEYDLFGYPVEEHNQGLTASAINEK